MASSPQLSVMTQLLTAPPVCMTEPEQGKHLHRWELQCLPGSRDSLGMSPRGDGKSSPVANRVSLSPPNSSASADGIRRKDLEVINFCHKSKIQKRMEKTGWCLEGFLGSCQFWWTLKASPGSHAGIWHFSKAARAQAGKAKFGNGEACVAQPTAAAQHFPTAPWHTTTCVGEISLQLLCATNKLVSDIFSGKVAPEVVLKSLEELLKAAVNSKKELRHCHCWSLRSCTLWTNLGLFWVCSVWPVSSVCSELTTMKIRNVCSIIPWKWHDVRIVPRCVQG